MSDPIWYFADGDTERGPVTKAQIKTLIGTGNLKRDDLVWTEGMEDWVPAGEVPGLFAEGTPPPPAETPEPKQKRTSDSRTKGQEKAAEKPREKSSKRKPNSGAQPASKTETVKPVVPKTPVDYSRPVNIFQPIAALGQPMLVVGFVLVLLARGCDSVAARLDVAKADVHEAMSVTSSEPVSEAVSAEDHAKPGGSKLWGVLRELSFWIATLVFSFGLLIVGFTGKGLERWFSLLMLSIIVFHFYVGYG